MPRNVLYLAVTRQFSSGWVLPQAALGWDSLLCRMQLLLLLQERYYPVLSVHAAIR